MKQFSINGNAFTLPEILAANTADEARDITENLDRLAIGESWSPDLQSEEITRVQDAPDSVVERSHQALEGFMNWLTNQFGGMTEGMRVMKAHNEAWIDGLDGLVLYSINNDTAIGGHGNTQAWNMLYRLYKESEGIA